MTYSFLASALRYPDADTLQNLADPGCLAAWRYGVATRRPNLLGLADPVLDELRRCSTDSDAQEQLRGTFVELFGHAVRGTCPPYEIEYGQAEVIQQASELADIQGFYRAFGLQLAHEAHERVDHVGAECEFMSTLLRRQVYAVARDDAEASQTITRAALLFLRDHLGCWLPALCQRLQAGDSAGFYGKVGAFAEAFIQEECACCGVTCGPRYLQLRQPDPANDASIDCAVGDNCPGAAPAGEEQFVQVGMPRESGSV